MADAGGLAEIELPLQTEGLVLKVPEEVTRQRRTSVGDAVSSACPPTTALCTWSEDYWTVSDKAIDNEGVKLRVDFLREDE